MRLTALFVLTRYWCQMIDISAPASGLTHPPPRPALLPIPTLDLSMPIEEFTVFLASDMLCTCLPLSSCTRLFHAT
jgi:hypothetical protein